MKFYIMDRSGHSELEFTADQKAAAAEVFAELIKEGRTAATRESAKSDYKVIRDPGQLQDETVFIPHLVGG